MMKEPPSKPHRTPACPECASTQVVPIVHGHPTPEQAHQIECGEAIVADREEWEGMSEWYCKNCHCDWSRHSRRY